MMVDEEELKKQARATKMRYLRSLKSPNCPPPVQTAYQNAMASRSKAEMQKLFDIFQECNEDWLTSSLVLEVTQGHVNERRGTYKWCTKRDSRLFLGCGMYMPRRCWRCGLPAWWTPRFKRRPTLVPP